MKVLFSYPGRLDNELTLINREFDATNWDRFHLRKPKWTLHETKTFLDALPPRIKEKTILHQSGRWSCHSFKQVNRLEGKERFCFLSPVFDSISKRKYKAGFSRKKLEAFLNLKREIKIIALGGVTHANYMDLISMGFDGGAFLGSVWKKYE